MRDLVELGYRLMFSRVDVEVVMNARVAVAQERLDEAKWNYDLHVGTGGVTNGRRYQDLIRSIELAELQLRAVLGNVALKANV
jgi:hypothetical protein